MVGISKPPNRIDYLQFHPIEKARANTAKPGQSRRLWRMRSSSSGGPRTPDFWEVSGASTSTAATTHPAEPVQNPLVAAIRTLISCFTPPPPRDPPFQPIDLSEDLRSSHTTHISGSSYDSSRSTEKRRSGRGLYNKSTNNSSRADPQPPGGMSFTIADIRKATRNFSPSMKIGVGGFGTVYKGRLGDGTFIAVKRAKKSTHGHVAIEFKSEIETLSRIEHLNLVRYFGYLEHEDEQIIVVEYVTKGTLREHLDCLHGNPLDLAARLDIAIDVAHAVTYLHMYSDHPIIHRDIKSTNILLTDNLRAKVADFGFARLGAIDSDATHVSTQVKGTAGYLDPEYLRTYQLTEKSDVYSFGVLLVELISGRRPIEPKREADQRITTRWVVKKFTDGNAYEILDQNLPHSPATNLALEKILELAFQCLASTRRDRPSMRRCAEILWTVRKDIRELLSSDPLIQPSHERNLL